MPHCGEESGLSCFLFPHHLSWVLRWREICLISPTNCLGFGRKGCFGVRGCLNWYFGCLQCPAVSVACGG